MIEPTDLDGGAAHQFQRFDRRFTESDIAPKATIMDITTSLTRHQIVSKMGVSDDALAFWIKREIVQASSGGEGKGSHRRFHLPEVILIGVLNALRGCGANIGVLGLVSARIRRIINLGIDNNLSHMEAYYLPHIKVSLGQLRSPKGMLAGRDKSSDYKYTHDENVLTDIYSEISSEQLARLVSLAPTLSREDADLAALFSVIVAPYIEPHVPFWWLIGEVEPGDWQIDASETPLPSWQHIPAVFMINMALIVSQARASL